MKIEAGKYYERRDGVVVKVEGSIFGGGANYFASDGYNYRSDGSNADDGTNQRDLCREVSVTRLEPTEGFRKWFRERHGINIGDHTPGELVNDSIIQLMNAVADYVDEKTGGAK